MKTEELTEEKMDIVIEDQIKLISMLEDGDSLYANFGWSCSSDCIVSKVYKFGHITSYMVGGIPVHHINQTT